MAVAILLAAGGSTRMGELDKLWVDLAGQPLLARPLRMLAALEAVSTVVVVAPRTRHGALRALARDLPAELRCVEGGARRQDSVAAGLAALAEEAAETQWVLVHDAARPLADAAVARRVLAAAQRHGAATPVVPVIDTIKRVTAADEGATASPGMPGEPAEQMIVETMDRQTLRAAQTPQGFSAALLRRAHAEAGTSQSASGATDDAALVERLGLPVAAVPGDPRNVKVTTAEDLALVRALLRATPGEPATARPAEHAR